MHVTTINLIRELFSCARTYSVTDAISLGELIYILVLHNIRTLFWMWYIMIQFCFASFMQCWDLGLEWSQNCHKILVSVYMGYRPSVHFFFLKTNLECNSYYKDETLETNFYTCHTQKSYSFYYFELEATWNCIIGEVISL